MKLYLMQHGEALNEEQDPQRPLSPQGEVDIQRLAELLRGKLPIQRIMHSGKLRARQSAELLLKVAAKGASVTAIDGIAPNSAVAAFADQLDGWEGDSLVVGHLPFMARLVTRLLGGDEERPLVAYQPGSLICLEQTDDGWQLAWMVRPELLRG